MRLIDAHALKKEFPHDEDLDYPVNTNCMVVETIDNAPTIDAVPVAPVRHGHWIFNQEDMTLHCSRCDEVFRFEETEQDECLDFMEYAKYCLACGAVMDEEMDA